MDTSSYCAQIETRGYCVIEGLLNPETASEFDRKARSLMTHDTGYVKLEGTLNHMPELAPLCQHPIILDIAGYFLHTPFYLANNIAMMWCQPGSPAGRVHADWPLGAVPEPYPPWPMLLQTMWMLTDFTDTNGATRVVPGTHLSGRMPGNGDVMEEIPVVGSKGSVLIWHGALWHRNGPNTSEAEHRMGANIAYIPSFIHRPSDDWPLVTRSVYDGCSSQLQQLLDRSVEQAVKK